MKDLANVETREFTAENDDAAEKKAAELALDWISDGEWDEGATVEYGYQLSAEYIWEEIWLKVKP